ncbi:MAG TPA: hypothetical protein PKH77_28150 [Anaerolineae bacterium]|nr:hypothetical protein [Anaerolineae bacterium]
MEALWQRLIRWAADCPLGITLRPGATEADIAAVLLAAETPWPQAALDDLLYELVGHLARLSPFLKRKQWRFS